MLYLPENKKTVFRQKLSYPKACSFLNIHLGVKNLKGLGIEIPRKTCKAEQLVETYVVLLNHGVNSVGIKSRPFLAFACPKGNAGIDKFYLFHSFFTSYYWNCKIL